MIFALLSFFENPRVVHGVGRSVRLICLSTFSTLLVSPKIQDTFSEQLGRQGTETENGNPGAREMYFTGRITNEITVQERTPRKALSGYLCAERGVRIGGCVAIQREESGPSCPFSFSVSSSLVAAAKGPSASFPPNS